MVEKRPGEELDDFSFKQPKYSEPVDQTVSNLYTVDENASEVHDCLGNSSWVTSDENVRSEAAFHILLSPDYYNTEDHVSIIVHPRVIYLSILDIPPQKPIPIGIDFQAELPESARDDHVKFNKFEGTCVIPMTELEAGGKLPGSGRTECFCEDLGSTRCVKQHVEESRSLVKMIIGTETFCKLGLNDMGEVVAEKWSEEENKMFHEVIYSNPESLGLNFWDQLVKVFPSRTKKEIVSYYFNVFMLRKRSVQNRCGNLSDIDSDNDDLEASDEEPEKINTDNDNRINSGDRENDSFINQEIICDDMVDQSICNAADICYRGELNGPDVESGSCNLRFDDEQQDLDCQNGDSKDVDEDHEQQRDLDCQNGDSKDVDERDLHFHIAHV